MEDHLQLLLYPFFVCRYCNSSVSHPEQHIFFSINSRTITCSSSNPRLGEMQNPRQVSITDTDRETTLQQCRTSWRKHFHVVDEET